MDPSKTSDMWIGIDLGSSNSCISVYQKSTQTTLIPTETGSTLLPSIVYIPPTPNATPLIGEGAQTSATKYPANTIFSAKRMIGRTFEDPVIQQGIETWPFSIIPDNQIPIHQTDALSSPISPSSQFSSSVLSAVQAAHTIQPIIKIPLDNGQFEYKTAKDIQAIILSYAREGLAQKMLHWDNVVNIVITVPAYFNYFQRQCTKEAGRLAGFKEIRTINEPSSAAFYFGYRESALSDRIVNNILIFDLGGGTLDVSLIDVKNDVYRVKAIDGDTSFGGQDIDKFLVDWIIAEIKRKYNFDVHIDTKNQHNLSKSLSKLAIVAEKVKKSLSSLQSVTEASISLRDVPENNPGYEDGFEITVDRAIVNKYFIGAKQGRVKSLSAIQRCLKKAQLTPQDVHKVVLVGGSTRIPAISKMVGDYFKNPDIIARTVNADEAVAYGACLHAATLSNSPLQQLTKPIELYDIIPYAYHVVAYLNDVMTESVQFIPRNCPLPRDQQMANFHQYNFPNLHHGDRVTLKVLETDEVLSPFEDPTAPQQSPQSPSPTIDLTPQQVLHELNFIYSSPNQPACPTAKDTDNDEISVELRLNGEYDIFLSVESDLFHGYICQNYLIHFETAPLPPTPIDLPSASYTPPSQPPPQPPRIEKQPTTAPQPPPKNPEPTPTPTPKPQQPIQPIQPPQPAVQPANSNSNSMTSSSNDLIHGKPATWWNKSNWIEVDDPTLGLFYKNKVTGETTLYYDDFDLDAQ